MSPERWTRAAAHGVAWGVIATATARLAWLGAMAVLARVLAPADFGLYALGMVWILYVETVSDLGLASAVIQWRGDEREAAQAAFVTNLVLGVVWGVASWWLADAVAALFQTPDGAPVVRALAPAFVLRALGNTHDALLQKQLRFRARFVPEAAMAAAKSGLGVALALAGFGVRSLVWAHLGGLAVWAIVVWSVVPWRPRFALPSRALLGELVAFGRWIVVVNIISAVVHHADKVFVGRELGSAALGLYQTAAKVIEVSITVWIWVVSRVLFPAFARLHARGEALGPAFLRAMRALALVTLPGSVALALAAEPVVVTLFGPAWQGAAPILRALAIYGALRALGSSAGDALKASGAANTLAGLAALKAVLLLPAVALAARAGAPAVAAAVAAVALVGLAIDLAFVARRMAVGAGDYLRTALPGLALAAAVGAATAAVELTTRHWPAPARLVVIGGVAGVVFVVGLARFEPGLLRLARERLAARLPVRDGAEGPG